MTDLQMERAMTRLKRRLRLENCDEETELVLEDALLDGESEILLYLRAETLEEAFLPKAVELAALFFRRQRQEESSGGCAERAYTEGQLSCTERYLTASDYRAGVTEIMDSLARYRRVSC